MPSEDTEAQRLVAIKRKGRRQTILNVPEEELRKFVMELAKNLTKKSSTTIELGKKAFYKQLDLNLADAYKYTSEVMVKNALQDDAVEGIGAFIEKREPNWKKNE